MSRPLPTRERWAPLRLGLADLFYYDQEEFAFRDGRLLLRGNNGTGKSKVLALTLPFLLDGELSAYRVEPDADPNKRMEWNLLLGGEHPHDERLGYTWLEFGRLGDDGPEFCTIGCGLKAVKGRGITGHWFFVTDRRVGEDLALVDLTGVPLPADRLADEIGAHAVYRSMREYRRAVDERLFGLGAQRYGALVDLLVKIRAPQLSKRPDERSLSAALTDALPPLDSALVHDVAEAFRALEDDAAELAGMVEARDASARYLATYRAYACMAARRRAAPLRQTQSVFDRLSREVTEAEEQHQLAVAELGAARDHLTGLRTDQARLTARQDALRADPLARTARELREAGEQAEAAARQRDEGQAALDRLAARIATHRDRFATAERELAEAIAACTAHREAAAEQAGEAGIGAVFASALATRDADELPGVVAELVARQRTGIERLEAVLARAQQAQNALAAARRNTEQRVSDLAETAGQRDATRTRLDERAASYTRDARAHLRDATELQLHDPATAFAALDAWLEALSGANPLEQTIAAAGHEAVRRLERQEAAAQARQDESRSSIAELEAGCAELERGVHAIPPAPHTRTADARTGRPGAPLWQLTDFRPEIGQDARAGLEAALEASGILDAWVTPTGELLDPHTEDTLLIAVENSGDGARLNEVLVGAADHVERLLGAIGLGESDVPVWVADNGRYRNGALRGAWHKPAAAYIGHAAREQARRARLAELREQLDGARAGLAAIDAELTTLAGRREQLERELDGRPSDAEVRHAHATLVAAEGEVAAAERRLAVVRVSEATAADAGDDAQRTLVADAADLGLPHERQPLDEITRALTRFETAIVALWPARDRSVRAERALGQAQDDVRGSEQERDAMAARLAEVERQLAAAIERRETLTETAGAAIEELERRLHEVGEALRANANGQTEAEARVGECQRAEGVADSRHQELIKQLSGATEERLAALDRLRRFASTGLIAVALPELEVPEAWNVTQGLRLAREIEQELAADADEDSRWARLQRQVSDELGQLADALRRHGNGAAMFPREEGIVVEVTFQGRTTTLPDLAHRLAAEVEARQRLLDSREREILENHLVGEVASALQELIVAAEERVRDTNAELAARPTSTGMQLRLRWGANPDAPDGLTDARRRLLRQMADAWSEEDRAAVGGYLQRQIQTVRASDATATWSELLTLAFDYRRWHRFTVERKQAGGWHPAGGPSSGGERVLAASVPLFAAASSYYSSASNPHAPRIVMLDEAFAGVDDRARAKCLGLLAAFDLDVVMTSEREWGCYAEVPGLAIAQLSRIDGVPAVLVTRWEWDGVERTRAGAAPEPALVPAAAPSDGPKLWDTSTTSD